MDLNSIFDSIEVALAAIKAKAASAAADALKAAREWLDWLEAQVNAGAAFTAAAPIDATRLTAAKAECAALMAPQATAMVGANGVYLAKLLAIIKAILDALT